MPNQDQFQFDLDAMVREDVFTDMRAGQIRRLTPINANGQDDPARAVRYIGQTQVMTNAGSLPLSFELEVDSLEAAGKAFADAAAQALEDTLDELQRLQRESQSSIMVPGQQGPGGGLPGGGFKL